MYSFLFQPHRDHLKHQVHGYEDRHRHEHLRFRAINLQPAKTAKRHSVKHKETEQDVASEKEMPLPTPLQTDDVSITSNNNELTLFPPIPDDDEPTILFESAAHEEIPIVSVHYNLPKTESTAMETTV